MGFCLKLATSKEGGSGLHLWRATKNCQNVPRGVTLDVHKCVFVRFFGNEEVNLGVSCFKSDGSLHAYLMMLFHISGVAGKRWPKGLAYNNGGLHSTSSLKQWWLPTPPAGGGAWTISLRCRPTPKRVSQRVPNPARRTFRHVSHFTSPLHEVPSPTMRSFHIVSRFASPLKGVPSPRMRSFRVVSCFTGCPIPELRLCHQQVHRLSRYGCLSLCVLRQCAEPHALRTKKKKLPCGQTHLPLSLPYPFPQGTACTALVPSPPP